MVARPEPQLIERGPQGVGPGSSNARADHPVKSCTSPPARARQVNSIGSQLCRVVKARRNVASLRAPPSVFWRATIGERIAAELSDFPGWRPPRPRVAMSPNKCRLLVLDNPKPSVLVPASCGRPRSPSRIHRTSRSWNDTDVRRWRPRAVREQAATVAKALICRVRQTVRRCPLFAHSRRCARCGKRP